MEKEWFKTWFNSPYYHILYKNRDETEARQFIDALLAYLQPDPDAAILDLACGKGRYSRYLAQKGYYVTGLDIAEESIHYARQFENDHLFFYTHDMRLPYRTNYFDYIFNFFTSFGYFETDDDHRRTIQNIAKGLKAGGIFVLDFFNAVKVIRDLKAMEVKWVNSTEFQIRRWVDEEGYILKQISFVDQEKTHTYIERVKAFTLADFKDLFELAGLQLTETFGDYQLGPFDESSSDRLILIVRKDG